MFGDAVLEQQAQSQIQKPSDFKPQLVVTDRWLRECILWSNWEEEAEYLFTGSKKEEVKVKKEEGGTGKGKGKGREGVKREKEDVEDEDECVDLLFDFSGRGVLELTSLLFLISLHLLL